MEEDLLPSHIRNSKILRPADIAVLCNITNIPVIDPAYYDEQLKNIFQYYAINPEELEIELHLYAKSLLAKGQIAAAWQVLLSIS